MDDYIFYIFIYNRDQSIEMIMEDIDFMTSLSIFCGPKPSFQDGTFFRWFSIVTCYPLNNGYIKKTYCDQVMEKRDEQNSKWIIFDNPTPSSVKEDNEIESCEGYARDLFRED